METYLKTNNVSLSLDVVKYTTSQAVQLLTEVGKELELEEPQLFMPKILLPVNKDLVPGCDIDLDSLTESSIQNFAHIATITHLPLLGIKDLDEDENEEDDENKEDSGDIVGDDDLKPIDGGMCTPYIRPIKDMELIKNCIDMTGKVCGENDDGVEEISVFCKISPLVPPIIFIRDAEQYSDLSRYPLEPYFQDLIKKDNSAGNVEIIALYLLSTLTKHGIASGFPIFYGGITGRAAVYFHDVTDEVPDFKDEWWFCNATRNGELDLCYIPMDDILDDGIDSLLDDDDTDFFDDSDMEDDIYVNGDNVNDTDMDDKDTGNDNTIDYMNTSLKAESIDNTEILIDNNGLYTSMNISDLGSSIDNCGLTASMEAMSLDDECSAENLTKLGIENTNDVDTGDYNTALGDDDNNLYYLKLKNYPVSVAFMEPMEITLDELISTGHQMSRKQWLSVLFQTAYNMAVANHYFKFVHNDLHNQNIMLDQTDEEFLYYRINGQLHKVPTFGYIVKIIDFARATFQYEGQYIMSDMFAPNGEAYGQYTYIPLNETPESVANNLGYGTNLDKLQLPNNSFDMIYLAYTIMSDLDSDEHKDIIDMLRSWCVSSLDGSNILDKECDFTMYMDIAHNCHAAVPIQILSSGLLHETFKCSDILAADIHVYNLDTNSADC